MRFTFRLLIPCFPQLRFYGVIEAFRQGRYPSNQQIDDSLKYVLDNSPVDQDQLSPEGRKLIQDCRDIIETARSIVWEKNQDELFQNFMWGTDSVGVNDVRKDPNQVLPVDKSKVQDDSRQGLCPRTPFQRALNTSTTQLAVTSAL